MYFNRHIALSQSQNQVLASNPQTNAIISTINTNIDHVNNNNTSINHDHDYNYQTAEIQNEPIATDMNRRYSNQQLANHPNKHKVTSKLQRQYSNDRNINSDRSSHSESIPPSVSNKNNQNFIKRNSKPQLQESEVWELQSEVNRIKTELAAARAALSPRKHAIELTNNYKNNRTPIQHDSTSNTQSVSQLHSQKPQHSVSSSISHASRRNYKVGDSSATGTIPITSQKTKSNLAKPFQKYDSSSSSSMKIPRIVTKGYKHLSDSTTSNDESNNFSFTPMFAKLNKKAKANQRAKVTDSDVGESTSSFRTKNIFSRRSDNFTTSSEQDSDFSLSIPKITSKFDKYRYTDTSESTSQIRYLRKDLEGKYR